ncbi:hypothetical protein FOL47_001990 [Perkinsus chesapeaki]|uniref:Uncharacterized protein n=1 Tax=Perkinsus chesapeaki TaxID=330153 RepID=A0A7J6MG30_PERCH|nr:hypothetical protein FOL47_001990 [Perkinsus chesapeaki]
MVRVEACGDCVSSICIGYCSMALLLLSLLVPSLASHAPTSSRTTGPPLPPTGLYVSDPSQHPFRGTARIYMVISDSPSSRSGRKAYLVFKPELGYEPVTIEDIELKPAYAEQTVIGGINSFLKSNAYSLSWRIGSLSRRDHAKSATVSVRSLASGFVFVMVDEDGRQPGDATTLTLLLGRYGSSDFDYRVNLKRVENRRPDSTAPSEMDHPYAKRSRVDASEAAAATAELVDTEEDKRRPPKKRQRFVEALGTSQQ